MGLSNFVGNTGTAGAGTLAVLVVVKRLLVMVGVQDINLAGFGVIYYLVNFLLRLFINEGIMAGINLALKVCCVGQ